MPPMQQTITLEGTRVRLVYTLRTGKMVVPAALIKRQGLGVADVKGIIQLHRDRDNLHKQMEDESNPDKLKALAKKLVNLDKKLSKLWRFKYDPNKYRFWRIPKCKCPKMDNEDEYPSGYYVISGGCPIHGDLVPR